MPADAASMGVSVDALARDWAEAIDAGLARGVKRRGSATQRFLVAMQGSVESAFSRLLETIISFIPRALAALLVLLLFWATNVRLHLRFWTDSRRSDFVTTSSRVRQAVLAQFRAAGVALPDGVLQVDLRSPGEPLPSK